VRPLPLRHLRAPPEAAADIQAAIRATAVAVPWDGGGTLLCRSLGRHKIFVGASDVTLAPHLALDGYWAWWITAFLARNLEAGETFVDGGACYGYMSLLAAELVGPEGRVLAVEPNPALFRLLERTLRLNGMEGRCQAVQAALGARDAVLPQQRLAAPPDSPMAGRLLPPNATEADAPRMILHPVPRLATLDGLAPEADVVKLRINGDEPQAWAGMSGLLGRRPGLRVLAGLDPARTGPEAAAAWLARIAEAGFPLRRVDHDGVARPTDAEAILATPGESTLWLSRTEPA
jgi:FkbM family methyltransferase